MSIKARETLTMANAIAKLSSSLFSLGVATYFPWFGRD
jgi:hypothetical protein